MTFLRNLLVVVPIVVLWVLTLTVFEITMRWENGDELKLPGSF